uniref:Cleavage and polyadenylation specificity factor subunit 2 n=1 Tax=Angiostrongylus cantonensis TaxID=6313 RepID=A0A0K0CSR3_ANGCA
MSSVVKVEPLSGVKDEGPLCYLLQFVDMGDFISLLNLEMLWILLLLKSRISQVILITHPDQPHLGALAYLVKYCDLRAPIYCTVPVYKMGMMFMYDWINSLMSVENFELFTLDDVDVAFDRIQKLKFNQTVPLRGDSQIKITALPAGHMIGGAMWRITRHDEEDIIYAVDYNHKKERHLNGCSFDTILRPYLLITDSLNALYTQPRRKERDEQLVTTILKTVRQNGDCAIVIDTAGRVLEIAHLLDQLWANTQSGLQKYNLVMMSHVAASVVEFAKSQVEWMSDKVLKSFEMGQTNPFLLRNVKLCHSQIDLARIRSPKVVLCSGIDMECGYSRELFLDWCGDSRNSFIITGGLLPNHFTLLLIYMAECLATNSRTNRIVALEVKKRVRLEGAELEAYKKKKAQKDKEESRRSCNVEYIEFEGRSDGESTKKLIAQMKPKQLILVHGSAQATRHLGHIFTPSIGEVVDATVASHIYRILLNDELFDSLEFIKVVYVNDPKLSEMKQLLINMGYSAEFSSGVLYIGGNSSFKFTVFFQSRGCYTAYIYFHRKTQYNTTQQ